MQVNAVPFRVTSRHGGLANMLLMFAASLLLTSPTANATDSSRYALLIVNTDYSQPLNEHRDDGQALKGPLTALGFRVTRYNNLNLKAMRAAMRYFSNKLEERPSSIGFVYFVGYHSRHLNQTYLLPARASLTGEDNTAGLNLAWVIDELKFADNRSTAVFINAYDMPDADHSIPLGGNGIASTLAALIETDSSLSLGFSHPPDSLVPADSDAQLRYRDWLVGMLSSPDSSLLGLLNDPGGSSPGATRSSQFAPWSVSGPDAREHWARTPVERAAKPRPVATPKRSTTGNDKPSPAAGSRPPDLMAVDAAAPKIKAAESMVAQVVAEPTPAPTPVPEPKPMLEAEPENTAEQGPMPETPNAEPSKSETLSTGAVPAALMAEDPSKAEPPIPASEQQPAETESVEASAEQIDKPSDPVSPLPDEEAVATESSSGEETPDARITEYLEKAQQSFKQQRLTTPKDDSTYFWAKKVLEIDPKNAQAHKLLNRAFGKYLSWASTQYQREDMRKAKRHTRRARTLSAYASRHQLRNLTSLENKINTWQPPPPPQATPPIEEPKGVLDTLKEWFGAEPEQQSVPDTEQGSSTF